MNGWEIKPSNASNFAGVDWGPINDIRWNGIQFTYFEQNFCIAKLHRFAITECEPRQSDGGHGQYGK